MEILGQLNRVIKGTVDHRYVWLDNGIVVASFREGLLSLYVDFAPEILGSIIPILNANSTVKELKIVTDSPNLEKYDNTIMSRLIYESKFERLLRERLDPIVSFHPRVFSRSQIVPEWCTRYIPLLQEKLPLELIRLLTSMLFYWITN